MSDLNIQPGIQIPLEEFAFTFVRSAGPGGQNVNKVNTKAVLRWPVSASPSLPEAVRERFKAKFGSRLTTEGELVLTSQRFRDQNRNKLDCIEKVRLMVEGVAKAPVKRRRTRPTKASQERRLVAKKQRSERKQRRGRLED
jgi:ribosome-associated protein